MQLDGVQNDVKRLGLTQEDVHNWEKCVYIVYVLFPQAHN